MQLEQVVEKQAEDWVLAKATLASAAAAPARASGRLVPGWRTGLRLGDTSTSSSQQLLALQADTPPHTPPLSPAGLGTPKRFSGLPLFRVRGRTCCHPHPKLRVVTNKRRTSACCAKVLIAWHSLTDYTCAVPTGARRPQGL